MVFLVGCSDSLSRVERDCWYGQQGIAVDSLYNRETPIRIDRHEAIPDFLQVFLQILIQRLWVV